MKILVTGGLGFIGSAVIRHILEHTQHEVVNVDKLTYAGSMESLHEVSNDNRYRYEKVDICNRLEIERIFRESQPDLVMHLAAESHVDRSINSSSVFIDTNIVGTYQMLEVARQYWNGLCSKRRAKFRFHHISTDEVYGDLGNTDDLFTEDTPYSPSSPYSASKAGSDHLVRAWQRTYGFPTVITSCSNNYGPFQFPEKLIPLMIMKALNGKPLTIFGDGRQIRDWLHVEDHAKALIRVITDGRVGETYNIGGNNERTNIDVVKEICILLEELRPNKPLGVDSYESLITHVADRPGHDLRYAIDSRKIQSELDWFPEETFKNGIRKTVEWYLSNMEWSKYVLNRAHQGEP